jgi:outer membrane protein assembly factor BamA
MRPGSTFDRWKVDRDVSAILAAYNRLGYASAEVSAEVIFDSGSNDVTLQYIVQENRVIRLSDIELAPEIRSSKRLLTRLARLSVGRPLRGFDREQFKVDLMRSGLYRMVGDPELRMVSTD